MNCDLILGAIVRAAHDKRLSNLDRTILTHLLTGDGVQTRKQIAEAVGCATASVPRSARKLEGFGYISRAIDQPKERASVPTRYRIPEDTLRTPEDMDRVSLTLPSTPSVKETRIPSIGSVVEGIPQDTEGGYPSPPTPPYKNITPTSKVVPSSERTELGGEGGPGGDLFGEAKPSRRKRKFTATDDAMPREMTPRMVEFAAKHGYLNGSGQDQFRRWRTNRIANGTLIADIEASFQTWILNAPKFGMVARGAGTLVRPVSGSPSKPRRMAPQA